MPRVQTAVSSAGSTNSVEINGSFISFTPDNLAYQEEMVFATGFTTGNSTSFHIEKNKGKILPEFYFKYVKDRFSRLECRALDKKLNQLSEAAKTAHNNGQSLLEDKIQKQFIVMLRESEIYAKGCRYFISKADVDKYKHKIKGEGNISDTRIKSYTRIIPKRVLNKLVKFNGLFDDYVIYHYFNDKQADVKNMSANEKQQMKDPIIFGILKENTDKLYFIADWKDEYCDLTFDKMCKVLSRQKL